LPKNPYTNLPFSRANLYNIYIACQLLSLRIHPLFQRFMLSNFSIQYFSKTNDIILRETAINQYFIEHKDTPNDFQFDDISIIIEWYSRTLYNNPLIHQLHPECPQNEIVKIFMPYLKMYYEYTYLNSAISKIKLLDCLVQFYAYNPNFGRAYMIPGPQQINTYYGFDLRHFPFSMMDHDCRLMPFHAQIFFHTQRHEFANDFLSCQPIANAIYLSHSTTILSLVRNVNVEHCIENNTSIQYLYSSESESEYESESESES